MDNANGAYLSNYSHSAANTTNHYHKTAAGGEVEREGGKGAGGRVEEEDKQSEEGMEDKKE